MIVSPSALGAMILIFFSNPIGNWIQNNLIEVVFDINGIVVAQVITTLGLTVRFVKQAFDNVPIRYEQITKSFGSSSFFTFFKITLPNAKRGIFYAGILSFAKSIGEFGATITVAGSMQLKTETLPIGIFMHLSSADLNGAVIMITILITISFFILYFLRIFNRGNSYA
jgi:molybdate transport system permease protein